MKPRSFVAILFAVSSLAAIPAVHATIVYSSTAYDTGAYIDTINEGVPDSGVQITLGGRGRIVTSVDVIIGSWVENTTPGSTDMSLTLYRGGSSPEAATRIGDPIVRTGVALPQSGDIGIRFAVPDYLVPDSIIPILAFSNATSGFSFGPALYNGTQIGSFDGTVYVKLFGAYQKTTLQEFNPNLPTSWGFGLTVNATPVPGSLFLMAAGLAAFGRVRKGRRALGQ